MDFDKCLKTRRSVRDYKDKKINIADLNQILDAARYAPSAGNLQNWRFIIVENEEKRKKLAEACLDQEFVAKVPVVIVVCDDSEDVVRHYGRRGKLYSIQNCSIVIQNIMLKANDLGIGSCWVGAFDEDKIKALLKVPDSIRVEAIITLGYSNDKAEMPRRYDLKDLVYFEEWDITKRGSAFPLIKRKA